MSNTAASRKLIKVVKENGEIEYVLPEDIGNGEIYRLTSKTSGKSYVGQAKCFGTLKGNFSAWGTINRWNSHVTEARNYNDHCRILNAAIRKYGADDFIVEVLEKCKLEEMDDLETHYIKLHNTLVPNGYNILEGGKNTKFNDGTNERVKKTRVGKPRSDMTKLRTAINKIQKSAGDMPLYVYKPSLFSGNYHVSYPVIEGCTIRFIKQQVPDINTGKKMVDELDKQHGTIAKIKQIEEDFVINNKKKKDKTVLPEYVTPVYADTYKIGYKVSGFKYTDGTIEPAQDFISSNMNIRNLKNATLFLQSLEVKKANQSFVVPKLPPKIYRSKEISRVGTPIDIFKVVTGHREPSESAKNKRNFAVYKKFADQKMTLEERYNAAMEFYNSLYGKTETEVELVEKA